MQAPDATVIDASIDRIASGSRPLWARPTLPVASSVPKGPYPRLSHFRAEIRGSIHSLSTPWPGCGVGPRAAVSSPGCGVVPGLRCRSPGCGVGPSIRVPMGSDGPSRRSSHRRKPASRRDADAVGRGVRLISGARTAESKTPGETAPLPGPSRLVQAPGAWWSMQALT